MIYDERERTPATDASGFATDLGENGNTLHAAAMQVNVKLADRSGLAFTERDMVSNDRTRV